MKREMTQTYKASVRFCMFVAALTLTGAIAGERPLHAAETDKPAHSYVDGEQITIVLPVPPGGGFDAQARLFAPYFEKKMREISGADISVQVESRPGGGHLVAMQYVQNLEPDGRTFGYFNTGTSTAQRVVYKEDLDPRKYTPLGTLLQDARGFLARTDFGVEPDLKALSKRSQKLPILIGHTGADAQLKIAFGVWKDKGLDIKADFVELDGSSGTVASLLRKEIELGHATATGYQRFIKDNPDELAMYIHGGCERHPLFPDLPTIADLGAPEAKVLCEVVFTEYRSFFAPGGIPEGAAAVLSKALHAAIQDPEFVQRFEKATGLQPTWLAPEKLSAYVRQLVKTWEENAHYATE